MVDEIPFYVEAPTTFAIQYDKELVSDQGINVFLSAQEVDIIAVSSAEPLIDIRMDMEIGFRVAGKQGGNAVDVLIVTTKPHHLPQS